MKITKMNAKDFTYSIAILAVMVGATILIGAPFLTGASLDILYGFGVGCCLFGGVMRTASAWIERAEHAEKQQNAKKTINQLLAMPEFDDIQDKREALTKQYELKHVGAASRLNTVNAVTSPSATWTQAINLILVASLIEGMQNSSQQDTKSTLHNASVGLAGILQGLTVLLMILNTIMSNRITAYQTRLDKQKDRLLFFKSVKEDVRQELLPGEKRFLLDHAQLDLVEALNQGVIPTQRQPDPANNLPASIITRLKDYHFAALDKEKSIYYLLQENRLTPAHFLEYTDKQIKRINDIPRASMMAIVSLIQGSPAEYVLNSNAHRYRVLQDEVFGLAAQTRQIRTNDINDLTNIQTRQAAREFIHTLQERVPSPLHSRCRLM